MMAREKKCNKEHKFFDEFNLMGRDGSISLCFKVKDKNKRNICLHIQKMTNY